MAELTKKQQDILNYVVNYIQDHEYSPSFQEIGQNFGLSSKATVSAHVHALIKKGYLRKVKGLARSLNLTKKVYQQGQAVQLPLLGLIAAGEPIEAIEDNEMVSVPAGVVQDANSYVLKVKGQSMIEEGILDGDYVVVERNFYPQNGDVVVALLDNEYATLKKYFREKNRIRLQPANKTMKPIFAKNPAIQGIVRGIYRVFSHA
ncbi:MAG: transcriptional repressor LexA [Patescibacteria group bacterium]|nr:transcriptional repressor LexA [Patescibacteria group bacterium]